MKVFEILTGISGGFFMELMLMYLTEKLTGQLLRSDSFKSRFLMLITSRTIITLVVLLLAAMHSTVMMLLMGAGSILYIHLYIILKNLRYEKAL